jgi:hypothetical protein
MPSNKQVDGDVKAYFVTGYYTYGLQLCTSIFLVANNIVILDCFNF